MWLRYHRKFLARSVVAGLAAAALVAAPAATASASPRPATHSSQRTAQGSGTWQPEPATYGTVVVPNVSVTMDDGVALVGDVVYPADRSTGARADGSFPVLLTQNPYACQTTQGNLGPSGGLAQYFAQRGYIFASICVRGTGRSGGNFNIFSPREQQDGVQLVHWAAHQLSGSNGIVGLTGCSYLGITQLFTAGALPRHSPVKAILPACAGAETYRETEVSGGMPTETLNYFESLGALMGPRAGVFGQDDAADILAGGDRAYFRAYNEIRTPGNWAANIVRNHIPALLWTGWQDIFVRSAEDLYAYFQNSYYHRPTYAPMLPFQHATGRYQIIIGPWGHGGGLDPSIMLEWYDTWLKGEHTGMAATATPMHILQLGTNTWINTNDYPMVARYRQYYLNSGGSLTAHPAGRNGSDAVAYTQPDAANGKLVYQTRPFNHGATIAGPISATLYARSSSTNLNLITEIDDVAPDGTVVKLTHGSIVGSLRQTEPHRNFYDVRGTDIRPYGRFYSDHYLVPGRTYPLSIVLQPTVEQLSPGHSLRLVITTQMPAGSCGALLGTDPCYPTAPQRQTLPGTYQVEHGPHLPSAINLPPLPYNCFTSTGTGPEPTDFGSSHTGRHSRWSPCTERGVSASP